MAQATKARASGHPAHVVALLFPLLALAFHLDVRIGADRSALLRKRRDAARRICMPVNTVTAELFFKGGSYFKVGEPDRIFDDRVALEFGLPVDALGQPRDADALRADTIRGVELLHLRDHGPAS